MYVDGTENISSRTFSNVNHEGIKALKLKITLRRFIACEVYDTVTEKGNYVRKMIIFMASIALSVAWQFYT